MHQGQGVYFLQSDKNSRFYIGSTIDIHKRLKEHYAGLVYSTKNLRPLNLVFFQNFSDIKTARVVEYKLKRLKSRKIIEQIIEEGSIKLGP